LQAQSKEFDMFGCKRRREEERTVEVARQYIQAWSRAKNAVHCKHKDVVRKPYKHAVVTPTLSAGILWYALIAKQNGVNDVTLDFFDDQRPAQHAAAAINLESNTRADADNAAQKIVDDACTVEVDTARNAFVTSIHIDDLATMNKFLDNELKYTSWGIDDIFRADYFSSKVAAAPK